MALASAPGPTSGRFPWLLLSAPGEAYVADCMCAHAVGVARPGISGDAALPAHQGVLRITSDALHFEPSAGSRPVLRMPYAEMKVGSGGVAAVESARNAIVVAPALTLMGLTHGAPHPFRTERSEGAQHRFVPSFGNADALAQQINELAAAANDARAMRTLRRRIPIPTLASIHPETASTPLRLSATCARLSPLCRLRGRLCVADAEVCFVHAHAAADPNGAALERWQADAILAVAKRQTRRADVSVEVWFADGGDGALFTFDTADERNAAYDALRAVAPEEARALSDILTPSGAPRLLTPLWTGGHCSTFDYLMAVNLAAGRSRNDAALWPVFPWVLADYASATLEDPRRAALRNLSKPVGALNPERLAEVKARMASTPANGSGPLAAPYLYATHYSTPLYVFFFLLRCAPVHALRCQGWRFDRPERLFRDMRLCWEGATGRNAGDVKELIPELYQGGELCASLRGQPAPASAVLRNLLDLPLGSMQDGTIVHDVALPPWCHTGGGGARPELAFRDAMRECLESDAANNDVAKGLAAWIDLVFGINARGANAAAHDNVFAPLCYASESDLKEAATAAAGGDTDDQRHAEALEALCLQADEFGTVPQQVFALAHPPRDVNTDAGRPRGVSVYGTRFGEEAGDYASVLVRIRDVCRSHGVLKRALEAGVAATPAASAAAPALTSAAPAPAPAIAMGGGAAGPPPPPPPGCTAVTPLVHAHRGVCAAVAVLPAIVGPGAGYAPGNGGGVLYTAGDSCLRAFGLPGGSPMRQAVLGTLPLSSLALLTPPGAGDAEVLALAGSFDGSVYAYAHSFGSLLGAVCAHDDAVSCTSALDGRGEARLASGSWDGSVLIWDVAAVRWHAPGAGSGLAWAASGGAVRQVLEVETAVNALWGVPATCGSYAAGGVLVGDARGDVSHADQRLSGSVAALSWSLGGGGVVGLADASVPGGAGEAFVAALSDGTIVLLDARKGGVELARVEVGTRARLTCACAAGAGAVCVGDAQGFVHVWRTSGFSPTHLRAFSGPSCGVRTLCASSGSTVGGGGGACLLAGGCAGAVAAVV